MTIPDLLSNRPALPTTTVPGHHIVSLLSTTIHIRRYKTPKVESTLGETILSKFRDDHLEKAWKVVNGGKGERVLDGGCCIITQETEGDTHVRSLWVFSDQETVDYDLSSLGLEALPPAVIDIPGLVNCGVHGHDLSCLQTRSPSTPCDNTWTVDRQSTRYWNLFCDALIEKTSWKAGQRTFTRPGGFALGSPEVQGKLYPLSNAKLLLTVSPNPLPSCKLSSTPLPPLPRHRRPLLLRPLSLPALMLGAYTPTPAQEAHLNTLFESTLGPSWNSGVAGRHTDAQITRTTPIDWAVYWVPLLSAKINVKNLSPVDVAAEMQKAQGVITIWPHHLIHDLSASPARILGKPTPRLPIASLPTTSDLMGTASNLFDFLSSYQPQPSPQTTPEADDGQMDEDDVEPTITASSQASIRAPSDGNNSDIDDLFSAHSPSPTLEPIPLSRLPSPAPDQPYQDQRKRIPLEPDVVMSSPTPPQDDDENDITIVPEVPQSRDEGVPEGNFVTEDDFDFFDSPMLPKSDDAEDEPKPPDPAETPVEETPIEETPQPPPDASADAGVADKGDDINSLEPSANAPPVDPAVPHTESPKLIKTKKSVSFDPSTIRPPPHVQDPQSTFVPSPFAPIDIDNTSLPTFAYSLPSPAPTPESLRPELLERLRSKKQDQIPDYASVWEIESEVSEMEEDEDYSGAPPTPVSVSDTDVQTSVVPSPSQPEGLREATEISWEGVVCAGPEWTSLLDEPKTVEELGKKWSSGWNEGTDKIPTGALTPPAEPGGDEKHDLDDTVCDRLVEAIISTRHLRDLIMKDKQNQDTEASSLELSVIKDGVGLTELTNFEDIAEEEVTRLKPLDHCRIHTGFSGNVTQISVSALRYWRQLALQPSGGRKEITAFVVCEMDAGTVRAARDFLDRISRTYEDSLLGKHHIGEATAAKDGIVAVPTVGFVNSIAGLLSTAQPNTAIYVVLSSTLSSNSSNLIESILSTVSATPFVSIKLLPAFALQPRQIHSIAFEVYDAFPKPIRPITLRGLPLESPLDHIQYPYFTLAPQKPPTPELSLAWPLRSYDVMGKWRWIHAGYGHEPDSQKVVVFVADAEGEMWITKTWSAEKGILGVLEDIWRFITTTVGTVHVEYRLAVCSLGLMSADEIEGWKRIINPKIPVVLLMSEVPQPSAKPIHPRPQFSTIPPAMFSDPTTRIVDETLVGRTASLPRLPLTIQSRSGSSSDDEASPKTISIFPRSSFLLNLATTTGDYVSSRYHILLNRPPPQKEDEDVEDHLASDYHRLHVLGRMRFGMEDSAGPVHLEGVRMGSDAIRGITRPFGNTEVK